MSQDNPASTGSPELDRFTDDLAETIKRASDYAHSVHGHEPALALLECLATVLRLSLDVSRRLRERNAELAGVRGNLAACERELERWRHGVTIEGDYVCPDSLRADEADKLLDQALDVLADVEWGHDHCCPSCRSYMYDSHDEGCSLGRLMLLRAKRRKEGA